MSSPSETHDHEFQAIADAQYRARVNANQHWQDELSFEEQQRLEAEHSFEEQRKEAYMRWRDEEYIQAKKDAIENGLATSYHAAVLEDPVEILSEPLAQETDDSASHLKTTIECIRAAANQKIECIRAKANQKIEYIRAKANQKIDAAHNRCKMHSWTCADDGRAYPFEYRRCHYYRTYSGAMWYANKGQLGAWAGMWNGIYIDHGEEPPRPLAAMP